MKSTNTLFFIAFFLLPILTNAQSQDISEDKLTLKKIYHTKEIQGAAPTIDGELRDPIWETVSWGGDFIQYEPYEGKAPTQKTAFKILYDSVNSTPMLSKYSKHS